MILNSVARTRLYPYSKWNLKGTGPDGKPVEMNAMSSDLLRRQADGTWLIAIDNPWGTAILG